MTIKYNGKRYRKVEIAGITTGRKETMSRTKRVIINTSTPMTGVVKTSGSLKGTIANAKARSPFAVAHVPGQVTKEFKGVTRQGNKMVTPSRGRFKG